jgi:hypothetical protein
MNLESMTQKQLFAVAKERGVALSNEDRKNKAATLAAVQAAAPAENKTKKTREKGSGKTGRRNQRLKDAVFVWKGGKEFPKVRAGHIVAMLNAIKEAGTKGISSEKLIETVEANVKGHDKEQWTKYNVSSHLSYASRQQDYVEVKQTETA